MPDGSEACGACGQKFSSGNLRQATGTFSRRKNSSIVIENAPFKPGEVLCDRYVVKDAVGAGPLGFVFKAHDKEIDVEVALKAVSPKLLQTPDERRAFSKEIRAARKPTHNNLIRVYEDGEAQDRPFYTMQFLDGLTLRRIIDLRKEKNQFFSLREIEPIFAQIAAGLDVAHKAVVHSDLKPENIFVLPDLLKLSDLGIGNAIPRQPFVAAQKARGGNGWRYLAPEYLQGLELDRRADVYSLGVLLGEMVASCFPEGANTLELRTRNSDLPASLEALYRRATNENPLARQATVAEFWAELDAIITSVAPRVVPQRKAQARPVISDGSFEIRAEDANTPSAPMRPSQPPKPAAADRQSRRPLPPPVAGLSGEEPAFVQPTSQPPPPARPLGEPAATAESTEVMPVPAVAAPRRRAAHTPPPTRRRRSSSAGPLLWLGVLGVVAGVGGGYVYLHRDTFLGYLRGTPIGGDPIPVVATVDASAAPGKTAEERLEEERRVAEARRLEEEQKALEARRLEEERAKKADEEKKLAEAKRLEDEKRRKEALNKAFTGTDPNKRPVETVMTTPAPGDAGAAAPAKPGTCPAGMKLIPAGTLKMGSGKDDQMRGFDEKALEPVDLPAYCVDFFESPNRAGVAPQVHVTFAAAETACKTRGKRLCTEEEWERACKGPGNARFPYGAAFDAEVCNTVDASDNARNVAASGAFPKCRSAFGITDLSGNVAEWTSTPFSGDVADKTIKGGAADRPDYDTRCASRKNGPPGTHSEKLGFRCCSDPN